MIYAVFLCDMIQQMNNQLADAFEKMVQGLYAAILMDIQMPVMNGYEATEQIRSSTNPLGKTILIIAMTANAFHEDKVLILNESPGLKGNTSIVLGKKQFGLR